ncbi:MAG TPA: cytochrome c biogenesis protein CcdA, partial [Flavobacteriales bacterium]
KSLLLVLCSLLVSVLSAQVPNAAPVDPVKWSITTSRVDDRTWDITFKGSVQKGWYVYSQQSFGDLGPMPTVFAFDTIPGVTLQGKVSETSTHVLEGMDEVFRMNVKKFKEDVTFTQRIVTDAAATPITGRFDFQTCTDRECIFPDPVYFKVDLAKGSGEMAALPYTGSTLTGAQPAAEEPVKWGLRKEDLGSGRWKLSFDATVQDGWYIYSTESFGDGPIPTSITLDSAVAAKFQGPVKETGTDKVEGMDEMFGIKVRKYKHAVTFEQVVEINDPASDVTGAVNFMTCDDSKCIFPDPMPFTVNIAKGVLTIGSEVSAAGGECKYKVATVDLAAPVIKGASDSGDVRAASSSLWRIFLLGFLGGLVALLTPCVFPMIPLTVSFFTKGSEDKAKGLRNALTYGGFILGIYLLFSLPFHLLGSVNAEIFNEISTNPWLNIFFFVIFLVFAVSFFGYFEITLPSSWVNSMDQKASRFGGLIGIFFMALTLALVSFSCTGPILGSLLAGALSADGGAWQLTAGLGGFGLALALPFALFALFPSWLNSLPRSGSWLNSVKVVLGFAEVALAFKFLSNADLVKQWGIVPYELFMVIWVLCALGIVLYLFGVIKFPHDSPVKNRSALRWGFIGLFTLVTLYLSFGLTVDREKGTFNALSLMSGLAPPVGYSKVLPKRAQAFHDLEEALAYAKEVGKPVMVDFTGWACVSCRKMEEHVWPVKEVKDKLENYVLVSLYVDDKRELPKEQQHVYTTCTGKQKQILTLGNKWSTVQLETFVISSQPYYALLSPEGKLLTDPVGYTPNVKEYSDFLQRGIDGMRQLGQQASR